jgi:bacterioferritin-associated ferredoxin
MIVCHCRAVNNRQLINVIQRGATTIDELIEQTGCCTDCGTCESYVQEILEVELEKLSGQSKT